MYTLRLILSNNAVAKSRPRKKVEHSVGIGTLSLFVAEARRSRVPLHLAIESSPSRDVDSIVGDNIALCNGESGDWEGKSMRRTGRKVGLGGVWFAFDFVLALVDGGCLDQCRGDGGEGGSGELHGEECEDDSAMRTDRAVVDVYIANARAKQLYLYHPADLILVAAEPASSPSMSVNDRKDHFLVSIALESHKEIILEGKNRPERLVDQIPRIACRRG